MSAILNAVRGQGGEPASRRAGATRATWRITFAGCTSGLQALQSAAVELKGLEQEHYDDQQQAEREIERLYKLIADSQEVDCGAARGGQQGIAVVCGGALRRAERHVSAADLY